MNFFEVRVSLHADKALLVRAKDEKEAESRALAALESGEIDMTDAEVEDYVADVIPAEDDFYELRPDVFHPSDDEYGDSDETDDDIERYFLDEDEDDGNDIILTCERCDHRHRCDNDTKLKHVSELLTREYCDRMAEVIEAYGE